MLSTAQATWPALRATHVCRGWGRRILGACVQRLRPAASHVCPDGGGHRLPAPGALSCAQQRTHRCSFVVHVRRDSSFGANAFPCLSPAASGRLLGRISQCVFNATSPSVVLWASAVQLSPQRRCPLALQAGTRTVFKVINCPAARAGLRHVYMRRNGAPFRGFRLDDTGVVHVRTTVGEAHFELFTGTSMRHNASLALALPSCTCTASFLCPRSTQLFTLHPCPHYAQGSSSTQPRALHHLRHGACCRASKNNGAMVAIVAVLLIYDGPRLKLHHAYFSGTENGGSHAAITANKFTMQRSQMTSSVPSSALGRWGDDRFSSDCGMCKEFVIINFNFDLSL